MRRKRPDVPEDLALAVARCLEKDPENRWPTADALRRALESRTVTGYRPTGTSWRAGAARRCTVAAAREPRPARPATSPRRPAQRPGGDRAYGADRPVSATCPLPAPRRPRSPSAATSGAAARQARDEQSGRGRWCRTPASRRSCRQVRAQFATWLAVNGGLFMINVATRSSTRRGSSSRRPAWASGCSSNYSKLWQAGYTWRDVLRRPAAPDSIDSSRDSRSPRACCRRWSRRRAERSSASSTRSSGRCTATARRSSSWSSSCRPRSGEVLTDINETVDGLYKPRARPRRARCT